MKIDFKLFVRGDLPVKNVSELIAYAKKASPNLSYASAGVYTSHHLMTELFSSMAGFNALHVPYVGAVPGLTAVAAGQNDFGFSGFTALDAFTRGGKIRKLASTGTKRNELTPNLPTVGETLPDFSAYSWFAMWTRSEVPADIRQKIATEVAAIMKLPEVTEKIHSMGMDPVGSTPAEMRAFVVAERQKWSRIPPHVLQAK